MKKEIKEKIISQISALFNSHLLTENRQAREMFLTYLDDYLTQEKQKWAEEILQLVFEDVPHKYQKRLFEALKKVGQK